MQWKIVTDSGASIRSIKHINDQVDFEVVPLLINIDEHTYQDNDQLSTETLVTEMENAKNTGTACPSPETYAQTFESNDNVLCFTLSSGVSGSYNAACLGKELALEKNPNANIYILNSRSAGAEIDLLISLAAQIIKEKLDFEAVVQALEKEHLKTNVSFVLESVDNLVKNGRVSKIVGNMIGLLNIRLIGKRSPEGTIELAQKARGHHQAMKKLWAEIKSKGYNGGKLIINHVLNPKASQELQKMILDQFPQADIEILAASGLCSFYAQRKGLIIGYQTR
ncbi:DegV family protein [Facklamia miroungae]|uniref:EDD domain protein, DegV family n=1 Tax=Facklamia miroungae TaxID=120956 RepID=A0A1G7U5I1_9LACT|nr:DegV family protein [Facklamia miroungae]NKZ29925.1 DegV family protein [Facklamia miroungae]SDG42882.1 EDD domain protein, DegV family [Facklamia miroungae]